MFRGSSAHLQEDTVVYMQPVVLSLSMRVPGGWPVGTQLTPCTDSWRRVPTGHQKLT